jgi:bud site selection protein 31
MPKVRPGMPKPPKGFDVVADVLDSFDAEMKAAIAEPHQGKRKTETTWGVAKVNRSRTRAVWELFRAGKATKDVLDYCVKVKFIDGSLVRLWSLPGYETACCAECVNPKNHSFGGACICRVPRRDRGDDPIACSCCGCTGCASGEKKKAPATAEVPVTTSVEAPAVAADDDTTAE